MTSEKRIQKLGRILEKYDNVMLGKKSSVLLRTDKEHFGRRKRGTKEIEIGIKDDSIESCVTGKALNLHELGHIMFTRKPKTLYSYNELEAYNVLEDQRLEHILSNRYPGMKKYLVYLTKQLQEKNPKLLSCMLWGRRHFLPFKVDEPPGDIKRIIDSYLVSKNQLEREALAREFLVEMGKLNESMPQVTNPQNYTKSRKDTKGEQQASDTAQQEVETEKEENEKKGEQKAKAGQEKQEETKEGPQGIEQGEGESEEEMGGMSKLESEVASALSEVAKELDVPDQTGPGQGRFNVGQKQLEKVNYQLDKSLMDELYQIFRKVNLELQNTWNKNQRRGRIDIRAAMLGSHVYNPRIFKKYEQSKLQDNKISLVMIYDTSGSMNRNDRNRIELKSIAAMTVAATRASNEVCCIEFNSRAYVTKGFHETELKVSNYTGGTYPGYAIRKFAEIKKSAKYPIVLIIFTDGDFRENLGEVIDRVKLYKILIGSSGRYWGRGKDWLKMPDIKELPRLLKGIMTEIETEIKEKLLIGR